MIDENRQRLIYTGKVLKDEETLASYKLQNNREAFIRLYTKMRVWTDLLLS